MKNKIEDVRNHLVSAMEALSAEDAKPEEITQAVERAKAMSSLATSYINAVKVELDAIRLADEVGMLPGSVAEPLKCDRNRGGALSLNGAHHG
jgi:hypothetical protein